MIQLRMLGTVDLRDARGCEFPAVLRRPKLLALLGYLAVASPRGFHRRDTLVALLWPELDNAHARNSLRQAVHALRVALGRDVVTARGEEELALSEELLSCDVHDFETSFEAGDTRQALTLYRGPLLDGLHVPNAPEFERWLDQTRKRLEQRACEAARLLTEHADAAGDPIGSVRWARRWVELSPLDETPAQKLIELLDAVGDRSAALRVYQELERRLGRELEVVPSSTTRSLIDSIRTTDSGANAPIASGPRVASRLHRLRKRVTMRPQRLALQLSIVAAVCLTGGWLVFSATPVPKRLVVLPFINLGSAEDQYFADGITQEIAARLATINHVRVIGPTSANLYRGTTKPVRDIAAELGVDYVIEGTVRWDRSAQGLPKIRVIPQLTSAKDGTHLWVQVYDESLDELFGVQSDIAQKIVGALDIQLLESQRRLIQARPTRNLEAYTHYLRGKDYIRRGSTQGNRRAAIQMFERAVALDSNFGVAYAELARIHSQMYILNDHTEQRLAAVRAALNRALELAPDMPEAHHALGAYYFNCLLEYRQAARQFAMVVARRPSDPPAFGALGILYTRLGEFKNAFAAFENARRLEPASPVLAANYGRARALVRDFARAEVLYDRAIALAPDWPNPYALKAELFLRWDGTTTRARAVVQAAQRVGAADDPLVLLSAVSVEMFDRHHDQAVGLVAAQAPEVLEDPFSFVSRAQLYAQLYGFMRRPDLAHAYYDSARVFVFAKVQQRPDDPRLRSALGIAYAGLGRHEEAIVEGEKGVALFPIRPHADGGYYRVLDLARIYTMVGRHDAAIERLRYLLSVPGNVTEAWLRRDPTWDPLRRNRHFAQLVAK